MKDDRPLDPSQHPFSTFSLSSEIAVALRQEPAYQHGKNARALIRSEGLTVVTTALKAGHELKPHHAPGTAIATVLEGEIVFSTYGENTETRTLQPHDCAVFTSEVQHSVRAVTDSLLLLVIGAKTAVQ